MTQEQTTPTPPSPDQLQAWVDGFLSEDEVRAVDAWFTENPEEARRWKAYRADRVALTAAFSGVASEAIPDRLRLDRIRNRSFRSYRQIAALILVLAVGTGLGWTGRDVLDPHGAVAIDLPTEAAEAHTIFVSEVRHPVEVSVDQQDHLIAWLTKRLGHPVSAPPLGDLGFDLLGGRLLPSETGPAAQFMYQDASGRRLTLYIRHNPENTTTAFRFAEEDGTAGFYWTEGPLGYAIFAPMDRPELQQAADIVYDSLNF